MRQSKLIKKVYNKPRLDVVKVDHEISLVMASVPGDDDGGGGGPLPTGASMTSTPQSGPAQMSSTSEDINPFGGGSPDYN